MTAIDDRTLALLRIAASLTSSAEDLGVRVRDGRRTVVEVVPGRCGSSPRASSAPGLLTRCAFRRAVAGAHRQRLDERRLGMIGLIGEGQPVLDLATAGEGAVWPDLVVRSCSDGWLHLAAVATPLDALEHAIGGGDLPPDGCDVTAWPMDDLGTTVFGIRTGAGDVLAEERALATLRHLVGRCTVAEAEAMLGASVA